MFPYDRFHDRTTILGYDKKLKQVMAVTEPSPACFPWYARQDSNPPKADFAGAQSSKGGFRLRLNLLLGPIPADYAKIIGDDLI